MLKNPLYSVVAKLEHVDSDLFQDLLDHPAFQSLKSTFEEEVNCCHPGMANDVLSQAAAYDSGISAVFKAAQLLSVAKEDFKDVPSFVVDDLEPENVPFD